MSDHLPFLNFVIDSFCFFRQLSTFYIDLDILLMLFKETDLSFFKMPENYLSNADFLFEIVSYFLLTGALRFEKDPFWWLSSSIRGGGGLFLDFLGFLTGFFGGSSLTLKVSKPFSFFSPFFLSYSRSLLQKAFLMCQYATSRW